MDNWEVVPLGHHGSEVLAIHAALLADGRVAYFSGSEHNADQHNAGHVDHSRIWDPRTNVVRTIPSPAHDLFCCGHAFLGNGRLLVAGGTKTYDYLGLKETTVFDGSVLPPQNPWIPGPNMGGGRWYPTLVTLPDGTVVVVSGVLDEPVPPPVNVAVEVFATHPPPGVWNHVGDQPDMPAGYPRMHLLPDGQILCSTPMAGVCRVWSPITLNWLDAGPGPGAEYVSYNTTAVLLPLRPEEGYRARVMVAGTAQPQILDLAAPQDGWQPTAARALHDSPVRNHACSVLLPDATVVVVSGSRTQADADSVREAEIYEPATGQWSVGAAATVPRVYHNVALLLPDGRVWTAGSNHDGAQGHSELRMEVYEPDYLSRGPRPEITGAPASVSVPVGFPTSATFEIACPQAPSIASAALLRCGSITHAFDADQRYVGLAIRGRTADTLTVACPPTAEIAPPGAYFLFVVDANGVPSNGRPVSVQTIPWSLPKLVPGWFGWETVDGDIAVADISGSGRPDLVVFHIDNPERDNHGFYRIGWDLDLAGDPTGGWTDVKPVPGGFGWENQGGGIAMADISGTGRPDLVVFHLDNPGEANHGYYRIGWDLDPDGDPAGGWSEVKLVPGGFGWENQGGGIAVADISGNGRPDLVVFHLDNPEQANHGFYRIGWDVDANGDPAGGWTDMKAIPGGFGWENQGGGVAVADISGNGRPDLVVFHVDNPEGENHGFFRIGWDLDANGDAAGGWSGVKGVPGWFGWENQGGGVAVADISGNGRPDLIVFHVDNPDGDNHGFYRLVHT
jgi:hypothetical protein